MKHVAKRSNLIDGAKAKTLTQNKVFAKKKLVAGNTISEVSSNSRRKLPVQKAESAAVKTTLKNPPRAAKPIVKKTAPKLSVKTSNALKTIASARRAKPAQAAVQKQTPKAKRAVPVAQVKASKTAAQKLKPVVSAKNPTVEKKIKQFVPVQKAISKNATAKPKVSIKPPAKTFVKTAKIQSSKLTAQATKRRQTKVETAIKAAKIKSVRKKAKPVVVAAVKKPKNTRQTKPTVPVKAVARKKITPTAAVEKINRQSKKTQPLVSAKKNVEQTKKIKPIVAAKNVIKKTIGAKPIVTPEKAGKKTQKLKPVVPAESFKKRNSKIKNAASVSKTKTVEKVIEVATPRPQKPKNKKARPISSAVFRGKKERYDFKVFALNEKFEPIPAVYIISKRKTDGHKRGHHALICIGETASMADELKRHRKGKCVKKHAANAVSILPEADEKIRLRIETDLKAAHAVICNLD